MAHSVPAFTWNSSSFSLSYCFTYLIIGHHKSLSAQQGCVAPRIASMCSSNLLVEMNFLPGLVEVPHNYLGNIKIQIPGVTTLIVKLESHGLSLYLLVANFNTLTSSIITALMVSQNLPKDEIQSSEGKESRLDPDSHSQEFSYFQLQPYFLWFCFPHHHP